MKNNRNKTMILLSFMTVMVFIIHTVPAKSLEKSSALDKGRVPAKLSVPQEEGTLPDGSREYKEIIPQDNDLITINFIDVDIREVLSVISLQQEISIVPSQDVSGDISVHLYQVPLHEALESVALAAGCVYQKRGKLYYIYKPKEVIDPQAERLEIRVFRIKYAEIENIQEILESIPGMRLIKIHKQSKMIMVEDTPENLDKIESVIQSWDTEPRQVVIEALILEIALTDDMAMGVDWEKIMGDTRLGTGWGFSNAKC